MSTFVLYLRGQTRQYSRYSTHLRHPIISTTGSNLQSVIMPYQSHISTQTASLFVTLFVTTFQKQHVHSRKLTQHLKHWGWKMSFLLGPGLLAGAMLVFGRALTHFVLKESYFINHILIDCQTPETKRHKTYNIQVGEHIIYIYLFPYFFNCHFFQQTRTASK